jgi:hypothetical protein
VAQQLKGQWNILKKNIPIIDLIGMFLFL